MPYYNNRREYFDGALVLYQRDLAISAPSAKTHRQPMWYMRIKVSGMKGRAIVRSTKCTMYEEAYEVAYNEFVRIKSAVRLKQSLDDWSFEQHWNDWYERNLKENSWKEDRVRWHKGYFTRYFNEYFKQNGKSILLNDIDTNFAFGYWQWRQSYWQTDEGKRRITYNRKRKDAKSTTTNNAKKTPSAKTLKMEQSALNQIFYNAYQLGRMTLNIKFTSPTKNSFKDSQRAFFDDEEYKALYRYLDSYRKGVGIFKTVRANANHILQRQQLYWFVLFLANSGLRVGEARLLKWEDIKFNVKMANGDEIAEVRVSANAKTSTERFVQTQPNANTYLKKWKDLSPYSKQSHYVFFGNFSADDTKPKQFTDLNKSFQSVLKRIPYNDREGGLLFNADGKRRSLYSLRHVYASQRLKRGVEIYDLALNMGTSVKNVEAHYSHLLPQQRRERITQMTDFGKETPKSTDLLDEALVLFKEGKLSESAFMEIVTLSKKQS